MITDQEILAGIGSGTEYTLLAEPTAALPTGPRQAVGRVRTLRAVPAAGGRLVRRKLRVEITSLLPGDAPRAGEAAFTQAWLGLLPYVSFAGRRLAPEDMAFTVEKGQITCAFTLDFLDDPGGGETPAVDMHTLVMGGRYE